MPRPRLIHPVDVTIQPKDAGATAYRPNAREPVKTVARSVDIELPAQVQWYAKATPEVGRAGVTEGHRGYLIFHVDDLAALEYTPRQGDKVTVIGAITGLAVYLTAQEPAGHYDGQHWLLKVNFEDKAPPR